MIKFKDGTKGKLGVKEGDVYQWTPEEIEAFNTVSLDAEPLHNREVAVMRHGLRRIPHLKDTRPPLLVYLIKLYNGPYFSGGCELTGYKYNLPSQMGAIGFYDKANVDKVLATQPYSHKVEILVA